MEGRINISAVLCLIVMCVMSAPISAGEVTNFRVTGHYVGTVDGRNALQMAIFKGMDGIVARSWYGDSSSEFQLALLYATGQYAMTERSFCGWVPAPPAEDLFRFAGEFKAGQFVGTRTSTRKGIPQSQPVKLTKMADYVCRSYQDADVNALYVSPVLLGDNKAFKKINELESAKAKHSLAEFVKSARDMKTPTGYYAWWVEDCQFIRYCSPDLVSLLNDCNAYMGGAHENRSYEATNYWIRDGVPQPLKLSSLFRKDSQFIEVLSRGVVAGLIEQKVDTIREDREFEAKELSCFTIEETGLVFHFDSGILTCIATYHVNVPYAKLAKIIDPKGPLGRFVKKGE